MSSIQVGPKARAQQSVLDMSGLAERQRQASACRVTTYDLVILSIQPYHGTRHPRLTAPPNLRRKASYTMTI
jgi:hypothetical protein